MFNDAPFGFTQSPCQKCKKRFLGCHASCEDYIRYKITHDDMMRKKKRDDELRQKARVREVNGGVMYY